MKAEHKLTLGLEDTVRWKDPEKVRAADYTIVEVMTESGKVEDFDSVILIKAKDGTVAEVYIAEIE